MWHGVTVVEKPTGELIPLAMLKQRLRIDVPDDDQLLPELLKGAVARIDGPNGIGVAMMQQTWRKTMDCFPCKILLPGAPITQVISIKYIDDSGAEQTLPPSAYRANVDVEPAVVEPAFGGSWPSVRNITGALKVDYQLGVTDAADVPADLIDAVCLLVAHRYENREAVADGGLAELPLGVTAILNEHSRSHVAA
ncbi:head-tail connector protein [Chelativorans sp. AA-79]|uniref:head-tail connector protein n=1 Tax=Chelativorans sp. AA-79 TaxID=3028735 RepID=UPI0023F86382|nr:head-tail connector protein [Chelativorans sp. AA-79]WEX07375.1 head-tail connector protein [Chelativorans sp. AA-79]